ncbi:MAG: DNA-binding protein [Candidatus Verstraetearchaeota archaeon]|nr:DNA-binding protein [Candidatus Verstraetearchaeota archaeon]
MVLKLSVLESKGLREYLCNIPYDADLLVSLKDVVKKLQIRSGIMMVIGALRNATLYYYLQDKKHFHKNMFEGPLEIASGTGNIAILDDEIIVHCHLVLADRDGRCFGGHLAEGSRVFAGEVYIRELSPPMKRRFDAKTGLNLFDIRV